MSISYEEALSTLESMFGEPWTRQTLDTVLRHYQGHMENTVDALLRHGDKEPQALIGHLQAGVNPEDASISMDEQFARQLAQEERGRGVGRTSQSTRPPAPAPAPAPAPKGRGTPTSLPEDFLRVPGVSVTSTSREAMDEDEALARMLQDELFSQELANNPEFAHLARGGRPRMVGGLPSRIPSNRTNHIGEIPSGGSRRSTAGFPGNEGPNINIMETIADMGDTAKKRLAMLAQQFSNRNVSARSVGESSGGGGIQETRGLLDEDDEEQEMEMTFPAGGSKKTM